MEIISTLISVLTILVLVFLIVYVIGGNMEMGWIKLYLLSGILTTFIMVFIVVIIISWGLKDGNLATKVWAIYFSDNLPLEIITWLITVPISKYSLNSI